MPQVPMQGQTTSDPTPELRGKLGVSSIVFAVLAWAAPLLVVVGLMPAMIGFAGNGVVLALSLTMLIVLIFSVGYNTLTRYVKRPGAFYAYITAGLGKRFGLGGACVALFTYATLLLSTWAAFGFYAQQFASQLGLTNIPWYVWAAAGIVLAGVSAFFHVEFSAKTLAVALTLEVVLVLVVNLRIFVDGGPEGAPAALFEPGSLALGGFGLAVLFAFLCFGGFESSAIYREEAKDPERTVPRATYVAVIVIGSFYIVTAAAMLMGLGPAGIISAVEDGASGTMFSDLAAQYLGAVLPSLINGLVVVSTYATLLAQHNAVARYLYSFGRDGVLPGALGQAHPRHHSPYKAAVLVSICEVVAVALIAAFTGFESIGTQAYVVYIQVNGIGAVGIVVLLLLVSIAVFSYFRAHDEHAREAGLWRTSVAPVLGILGMTGVFLLSAFNLDALVGAGPVASTFLAVLVPLVFVAGTGYAIRLQRHRPATFARLGRQ